MKVRSSASFQVYVGAMGWTAGVLIIMAMLACRVSAVPQQLMYPYGPQHGDRSLPPSDDFSSDEIELSVPVIFFDTSFRSIYVRILIAIGHCKTRCEHK